MGRGVLEENIQKRDRSFFFRLVFFFLDLYYFGIIQTASFSFGYSELTLFFEHATETSRAEINESGI